MLTFFVQTGDEACMDASGYISITGRIKDLIIRGGENISPLEVENCLISHPDILEASVVGVKDEQYGEKVVAFIILREKGVLTAHVSKKQSEEDDWMSEYDESLKDWIRERLSNHMGESGDAWFSAYNGLSPCFNAMSYLPGD